MVWTEKLIERYLLLWDFKLLSKNYTVPWSINLLKKFANYWDLQCLKENLIVDELIRNIYPIETNLFLLSIGIGLNNYRELPQPEIRRNSTLTYERNWSDYNDDYCPSCMMRPCHCSDPDPG